MPAPATDVQGNFTVTLTVPAAGQGGSLQPGAVVITATVGQISGDDLVHHPRAHDQPLG